MLSAVAARTTICLPPVRAERKADAVTESVREVEPSVPAGRLSREVRAPAGREAKSEVREREKRMRVLERGPSRRSRERKVPLLRRRRARAAMRKRR